MSWYFGEAAAQHAAERRNPFYCDAARVGAFAVDREGLARGDDAALFRLFITLSMYQALRDVVVMRQQRELPPAAADAIASSAFIGRAVAGSGCIALLEPRLFPRACDVYKDDAAIDCRRHSGAECHVKDATAAFNRMGDMGKLPTSAWLHHWRSDGVAKLLAQTLRDESSPTRRADLLVQRFAEVHRVGRKLATLFVSALSTPGLAPGLTPWFPAVDGNELVVLDTNVARAVDALRGPRAPNGYETRVRWVREQAEGINLQEFNSDLPSYSPRLVQEALYAFCSKSNRIARGDNCSRRDGPCDKCVQAVCPFAFQGELRNGSAARPRTLGRRSRRQRVS